MDYATNETYKRTFSDRQTAIDVIHYLAQTYRNAAKPVEVFLQGATVIENFETLPICQNSLREL